MGDNEWLPSWSQKHHDGFHCHRGPGEWNVEATLFLTILMLFIWNLYPLVEKSTVPYASWVKEPKRTLWKEWYYICAPDLPLQERKHQRQNRLYSDWYTLPSIGQQLGCKHITYPGHDMRKAQYKRLWWLTTVKSEFSDIKNGFWECSSQPPISQVMTELLGVWTNIMHNFI